jgi:glycosyltransferase involved in cell wall biosynthesis
VLTSDVPENKEVVSGAGFTFHHGNQADLEQMLDFLLRNPELRTEAAMKARQRVAGGFLWPGIARSIETLYCQVLGWPSLEKRPAVPVVELPAEETVPSAA